MAYLYDKSVEKTFSSSVLATIIIILLSILDTLRDFIAAV